MSSYARTAAINLLRSLNQLSRRVNREFAGSICRTSAGRVYTTGPNRGTADSSNAGNCPTGDTRIGTYHTHAAYDPRYDNESFSRADKYNANERGVPNFVATPNRNIKVFLPDSPYVHGPGLESGRFITFKERTR